ncbi:glycosyltransferase 87 family protein [Streptomyces sp. NBC_01186]|uniref:glycosyltransferase 87 family protein n=1 Tax=Streptomyces sp. NBC_01186 TaxID=2903765 RepID=UPI003FA73028
MTAPTSHTSPPAVRTPLTRTPQALGLFALSVAGFVVLAVALRFPMSDVLVYRAEGSAVWNGTDLYGFAVTEWRLPATYPPFAALLFVPVALVPLAVAKAAFVVGNVALLAALVRLSLRAASGSLAPERLTSGSLAPARLPLVLVVTAGALWLEPVFQTVAFGQVNLIMACLVLGDLSRPDGARGKGFVLGVAAGIKLTPALFVVYLLLTGRFRAGLTAVGGFAASVAVGALALPGASVEFWTRRVFETGRVGKAWIVDNQSLQGLIARLAHDPTPGPLWLVPAGALAVAGMWLARRAYVRESASRTSTSRTGDFWGVQVTALVSLLVSPISWSHHWVWCVPLLIGLAALARHKTGHRAEHEAGREAEHRAGREAGHPVPLPVSPRVLRRVSAGAVVVFAARTMWMIPKKGDLDLRLPWWQQPFAAPYPLLILALPAAAAALSAVGRGTLPLTPRVPPARIGRDHPVGRPTDHPVDKHAASPADQRGGHREHECVEARGGRCAKHDAGHPADRDPTAGARGAGTRHVPGDHLDGDDRRR